MKSTFVISTLIAGLVSSLAHADYASEWSDGLGYQARLIQGTQNESGLYQAALEIFLEPGWKTYWRMPGDNGIPPDLSFQASSNVDAVNIYWPKPIIFREGDGYSVGYENHVVLPFTVEAKDKKQPADLKLSAFFGVCAEICVPAQEQFNINLDPRETYGGNQPLIDAAMRAVPKPHEERSTKIRNATLTSEGGREFIEIDVALPGSTDEIMVLAEGPTGWYFEPYQDYFVTNAAGMFKARVPIYRNEKKNDQGNMRLKVTVITEHEAVVAELPMR